MEKTFTWEPPAIYSKPHFSNSSCDWWARFYFDEHLKINLIKYLDFTLFISRWPPFVTILPLFEPAHEGVYLNIIFLKYLSELSKLHKPRVQRREKMFYLDCDETVDDSPVILTESWLQVPKSHIACSSFALAALQSSNSLENYSSFHFCIWKSKIVLVNEK